MTRGLDVGRMRRHAQRARLAAARLAAKVAGEQEPTTWDGTYSPERFMAAMDRTYDEVLARHGLIDEWGPEPVASYFPPAGDESEPNLWAVLHPDPENAKPGDRVDVIPMTARTIRRVSPYWHYRAEDAMTLTPGPPADITRLTDTEPNVVGQAMVFAMRAHDGQTDKAGDAYIRHCQRVAAEVTRRAPEARDLQAAAWLHEVGEDTDVEWGDILDFFGARIADLVEALTHRPNEPRDAYYARILACPGARVVKLADIRDNTDPKRLAKLDPETRARLRQKYAHATAVLTHATALNGGQS